MSPIRIHATRLEDDTTQGTRAACSCGWKGEWRSSAMKAAESANSHRARFEVAQ
jgi:hypothetical protein